MPDKPGSVTNRLNPILWWVLHTHEHSLTLLLHEEELSPVSGCSFYPKNHQVAEGQHPQEGRGEELTQGALTVDWGVQAEAVCRLNASGEQSMKSETKKG